MTQSQYICVKINKGDPSFQKTSTTSFYWEKTYFKNGPHVLVCVQQMAKFKVTINKLLRIFTHW